MGEALFWGTLAGSSLILGGAVGVWLPISREVRGLIMGFGAGVLISAVAYELFDDVGYSPALQPQFVGDVLIDRMGSQGRKRSEGTHAAAGGAALAIVLGD